MKFIIQVLDVKKDLIISKSNICRKLKRKDSSSLGAAIFGCPNFGRCQLVT